MAKAVSGAPAAPPRGGELVAALMGSVVVEVAHVGVEDLLGVTAARSPISHSNCRACWVTQAAVGWAVTPRMCTRRVLWGSIIGFWA